MSDDVDAANVEAGIVVLRTGEVLPITVLFDADGEETNDLSAAVGAEAGPARDGTWRSIDLTKLTGAHEA